MAMGETYFLTVALRLQVTFCVVDGLLSRKFLGQPVFLLNGVS
jgi:hypothetical protein